MFVEKFTDSFWINPFDDQSQTKSLLRILQNIRFKSIQNTHCKLKKEKERKRIESNQSKLLTSHTSKLSLGKSPTIP